MQPKASQNLGLVVTAVVGLGLLGFLFLTLMKNRNPQPMAAQAFVMGAGLYANSEEWEIEWNKDGLPKKVTIHRMAHRK
mgnify:FL=1